MVSSDTGRSAAINLRFCGVPRAIRGRPRRWRSAELAAAPANLCSGCPERTWACKQLRERLSAMVRAHHGGTKREAGTPKVARSSYAESPNHERSAATRARAPPPPERNGADFAAPRASLRSGRLLATPLFPLSLLPNPGSPAHRVRAHARPHTPSLPGAQPLGRPPPTPPLSPPRPSASIASICDASPLRAVESHRIRELSIPNTTVVALHQ